MSKSEQISKKELIKWYKDRKLQRKRDISLSSYHRQKKLKNGGRTSKMSKPASKEALWKRKQRERKKEKQAQTLKRVQKYRERRKNVSPLMLKCTDEFKNKMEKSRAISRLRNSLPKTPEQRKAVLEAYMEYKSPTAQNVKRCLKYDFHEEKEILNVVKPVLDDLKSTIKEVKSQRSDDARIALNVLCASINGESVQKGKLQKKVARSLGLPVRRLSGGKSIRTRILTSDNSSWTHTQRKTRSDAISDQDKRTAYEFWLLPQNCRPTCNKNDVKRVRIGPKVYSSHMVSILEKSQTDVYVDFKISHPNLKMSQRAFEKCKPFYVQPVRPKDRHTCLCRYHIEAKTLFKSCMNFRKKISNGKPDNFSEQFPIYSHIDDLIKETLCQSNENEIKMKCLNRDCPECGVEKLVFHSDETDISTDAPRVSWSRYEYMNFNTKNRKTVRKLSLVKKETSPGEMFSYFKSILVTFPSHQFRARWQQSQLKSLRENLPLNHCLCIHDFSENYSCFEKDEIQSSFYQKNEVSIHVTVIHRHAITEYDNLDSSEQNPNLITEHFFLISPDLSHDHNFSQHAQLLISQYLKSINYDCRVMHEFTDGCQCQYKSRHCMGGLTEAPEKLGYRKIIRNYFESSHGKGAHDAAGGQIKNQADLAVRRGTEMIQNAKDFFDFAEKKLQSFKTSNICKRRIFRYVESIPRENNHFRAVARNRTIHQVSTTDTHGELLVKCLSCYSCDNCTGSEAEYEDCSQWWMEDTRKVKMVREKCQHPSSTGTLSDLEETTFNIRELAKPGCIAALYTDDRGADFYLFKIDKEPEILDRTARDQWGGVFLNGQDIIRGHYYDRTDNDILKYKLIRNRKAIVPTESVRHIIINNEPNKTFLQLNESDHLDILASLDY